MKPILLSDADLYFYRRERYTIQYVLRFAGSIDADRLRRATLLTAAGMPPVGASLTQESGRLALGSGPGVSIREHGGGGDAGLIDEVRNLPGEPLVKLLITRGERGDSLGVSFSHLVGDGASFFLFLRALQAHFQGEAAPAGDYERGPLMAARAYAGGLEQELFAASGYTVGRTDGAVVGNAEELFLSHEELAERIVHAEKRGCVLRPNSLIMGLLAKRVHDGIPLHQGRFIVRCPVDYRRILGLGANYFGNAVLDAVAEFSPAEIRRMDAADVAARAEEAIRGVTPDRVRRHLAAMRAIRETRGLGAFEELACPGLLVSNLTRNPFAELDFGAGPPIEARPASVNPRLAVILRAPGGYAVRFRCPFPLPPSRASSVMVS